jgi:hypothetical protein
VKYDYIVMHDPLQSDLNMHGRGGYRVAFVAQNLVIMEKELPDDA